jgi:FlgN protein
MHPSPNTNARPLADRLLDELAAEEGLLREAREGVMGLYAALRKGDIPAVQATLPANDALAEQLKSQGEAREATVARLATQVGWTTGSITLAELAARLPDPYRTRLMKARTTLRDLTTQVEQFRFANANLIDRLRSYFQDVLSGFTAQDTTVRYGPSGEKVSAPGSRATVASG